VGQIGTAIWLKMKAFKLENIYEMDFAGVQAFLIEQI